MAFTYFFRDRQTLEVIQDLVAPKMRMRRYNHIWDAGCATGPEPYSLAIILRENMGEMVFRNIKIHATDIDDSDQFSDIIRQGIYPEEQVKRIPKEIFEKYFIREGMHGYFRIVDEIRKCIFFQQHDLLSLEPIYKDFVLIVCKNVLLHFKEQERINVIRMFYNSLVDGGLFVTEHTQKLPTEVSPLFDRVVSNAQMFQKV